MAAKKSFRDEVAEQFIKSLEEKPLEWHKSWQSSDTGRAINITTNKPYKGVNSFWLKFKEDTHGYGDNRWATFNQIKENGWKLTKGSKGEKVEFYMPIDNSTGKSIAWDKYNMLSEEEKAETIKNEAGIEVARYRLGTKVYTVFNASQIEGVPELNIKLVKNDIKADEVVQRIAEGMNVEIREVENSNRAFYSPGSDYINMPKASQFNSDYDYAATALHELGHSTGHESRLNRDLTGGFGSKKYAYEELIAEITSTFMSEYVEAPITEDNMQQHKAYIQSWVSSIKDNKNYLFKAISKAEEASEYMIEKGEIDKILETDIEKEATEEVETIENREYLKIAFHERGSKFVTKDFSNQVITKEILDSLIKEDEELYVYNEIVGKDYHGELTSEYQHYYKVYISQIFEGKEIGKDRIDIGDGVFCNHNAWAKLYEKIGEKMPNMEYQIPKIYKDTCKAEIENFFNETDKTWISRAELSMYAIPTTLMQFSTDELKSMRDYIDDKLFAEPKFDVVINVDEKTKEKVFDRLGFSNQRGITKQKDLDMEL